MAAIEVIVLFEVTRVLWVLILQEVMTRRALSWQPSHRDGQKEGKREERGEELKDVR